MTLDRWLPGLVDRILKSGGGVKAALFPTRPKRRRRGSERVAAIVQTLEDRTLLSAPTAFDQSEMTVHDQPLANMVYADDLDGDPLTYHESAGPGNGTLQFNSDGTFTYTPAALFTGNDSFTWYASGGGENSNVATVYVNVTNQAPTAFDQSEMTPDAQPVISMVYADDLDGDPLVFSLAFGPSNGALAFNGDGSFSFTPNPGFSGSDGFTWWASDGIDDSNVGTVIIDVTNAPPAVTTIANQDSIEGRNVSLQVTANDPDGDALQYSAQGLPDGLTINQNTGLISGKLSYTSSGSHAVTVTVTDTLPAATAVGFTWTVADTAIGTLKGTEYHGSTETANSVTVAVTSTETLFLSPGNTMQLEVSSFQGEHLPLWSDILFEVVSGANVSPSSGDFSNVNWPQISISGSGLRTVYVGIDLNGNGTRDAGETEVGFRVKLINLSDVTIKSQRVGGGPVEPGLTSIKATEHFEVGGQFKFAVADITESLLGANALIGYELHHSDGSSAPLLASGSGSLTYTFGTGAAEGDAYVWVYNDKNNNGTFDNGEPFKQSPLFHVMQKRVFNIVADVSDQIPNASGTAGTPGTPGFAAGLDDRDATNPGLFQRAENLLLRKDSEQDWRAAVQFNVTSSVFEGTVNSGPRPDPVATQEAQTKHFDAAADVVFVNDYFLNPNTMGVTRNNDWHQIIIHYGHSEHTTTTTDANGNQVQIPNEPLMSGTLAHELGHGVGLGPEHPADPNRVMTSSTSGTYDHVTQAEAKAYDAGP